MYYVYLLKSKYHRKSYIGCTDNIERRLDEHNAGKSYYTKRFKPWMLIKSWTCNSHSEARQKERYYKSGIGRRELKKIFDEYCRVV